MTYTFPKDFSAPVLALCALGEDPARQREWIDYQTELGLSEEHIPELIRIVEDIEVFMPLDEDLDEDAPEIFSSIHAWRALGQLKAKQAIPTLIDLAIRNEELDIDWIFGGIPKAMALIGPVAIPALKDYLSKEDKLEWATATLSDALADIGKAHPESRMDCIKAIESGLKNYQINSKPVNATLIGSLMDLKASKSDALVKPIFHANKVDLTIFGDYENYQLEVGLIEERKTPQRNFLAEEHETFGLIHEHLKIQEKANELYDLVDPDILKGLLS